MRNGELDEVFVDIFVLLVQGIKGLHFYANNIENALFIKEKQHNAQTELEFEKNIKEQPFSNCCPCNIDPHKPLKKKLNEIKAGNPES